MARIAQIAGVPFLNSQVCPLQIVAAGRRKHFYIYDLAGGGVSRIPQIAGVPDRSLETFVVSPAGQVEVRKNGKHL